MTVGSSESIPMSELTEMFSTKVERAYILEDGTIVKLNPFSSARSLGDTYSLGQVIHFTLQDVFNKDEVEDNLKPVRKTEVKYEDEENPHNKVVSEGEIIPNLYEGVVASIIDLSLLTFDRRTEQKTFDLVAFNENFSQEFIGYLFGMVARDKLSNGVPVLT
jgi:hypothetical protein